MLDTVYETEFFPKTVFETRQRSPLSLDPTTVFQTSTTTSTYVSTRVEPVYVTATEVESTFITTTVTHLVYNTLQQLQSLLHTKFSPQLLTTTVFKEIFHTDVATVTRVNTQTVTQTENIFERDCPGSPDNPFAGSLLNPQNRDPFTPPYRATSPNIINDISQSNSDPQQTFTDPLPSSAFNPNNFQFGAGFQGSQNFMRPVMPQSFDGQSLYHPGGYGPLNNPFHAFDNKIFNYYRASHPIIPNIGENTGIHGYKYPKLSYESEEFLEDDDEYSQFTLNDIRLKPSRPDPTSISDIIEDSYSSKDELADTVKSKRIPKRLYGERDNIYGSHSIYHSGEYGINEPSFKEGEITIKDYTADGGDIHIKEIMKGVKGGDILEEIHNHGLVVPTYTPYVSPIYNYSYYYPNSYANNPMLDSQSFKDTNGSPYGHVHEASGTPVYEYKGNHDADASYYGAPNAVTGSPRSRLSELLRNTLKFDDHDKQIHAITPKKINVITGHSNQNENNHFLKHRYFFDNPTIYDHNRESFPPQTLYRSEYLKTKNIHSDIHSNEDSFDHYGAHSTPFVTNVNGSRILNFYGNTSSNTFTPSKLVAVSIPTGIHASRNFLPMLTQPLESSATTRRNIYLSTRSSDWTPLIRKEDVQEGLATEGYGRNGGKLYA